VSEGRESKNGGAPTEVSDLPVLSHPHTLRATSLRLSILLDGSNLRL